MATSSPSTFQTAPVSVRKAWSAGTFCRPVSVPRTAEQRDRILDQAARQLRIADDAIPLVTQLARFLGAASSVWTPLARARLRALLVLGGSEAVDPVLHQVAHAPKAEVSDDAERVLVDLLARWPALAGALCARAAADVSAPVRAVVIRALGRSGLYGVGPAVEVGLKDPSVEVRDAAALALARLALPDARAKLERHLARESHPVVRDAIATALEELPTP